MQSPASAPFWSRRHFWYGVAVGVAFTVIASLTYVALGASGYESYRPKNLSVHADAAADYVNVHPELGAGDAWSAELVRSGRFLVYSVTADTEASETRVAEVVVDPVSGRVVAAGRFSDR